jgi:glycosyltransferase involved in cell wall biosynthesis
VLAGEGPPDYVKLLQQQVAAHQAEDRVLFPGWLEGETKDAFLRHAALLALPSFHENFGLCVMEALAAGVPVLVSPHVNLAAEIEAARAGWITEVKQFELEATLAEALRGEDERTKRGKAGKLFAKQFSCEAVASRLNELYLSVTVGSA